MNKKPPFPGGKIPALKGPVIAPNLLPGVKKDDLVELVCKHCDGKFFLRIGVISSASKFQTINATPTLVEFAQGFMCGNCGKINDFKPVLKEGQKMEDMEEKPPFLKH